MQKKTKRILLIVLVPIFIAVLLWVGIYFSMILSFIHGNIAEDEDILSFDNKYTLSIKWESRMSFATVINNKTKEIVFTVPESYRDWDFWGFYWNKESYSFWQLSSDLGLSIFVHDSNEWWKGYPLDDDLSHKTWTIIEFIEDEEKDIYKDVIPREYEMPLKELPEEVIEYIEHMQD